MNNFYVLKKGEIVGEAVVLTVVYVHFYNSRGSHQFSSIAELKSKGYTLKEKV